MLELLLVEFRFLLQYFAIAVICILAWRIGEAPERQIAIVFVVAVIAEWIHWTFWPHTGSTELNYFHLFNDTAMFIGFAYIAMRANRIYPLWILAAQLIATLVHFQRAAIDGMHPLAYWALVRLPFYLQMLTFAIGLWSVRRRRNLNIHSRPWRRTSNP